MHRLFDVERRERRTATSKAIVLLRPGACLRCQAETTLVAYRQSALFWSHGYGATEQTTYRYCEACGWFGLMSTTEVAPDPDERAIARGAR